MAENSTDIFTEKKKDFSLVQPFVFQIFLGDQRPCQEVTIHFVFTTKYHHLISIPFGTMAWPIRAPLGVDNTQASVPPNHNISFKCTFSIKTKCLLRKQVPISILGQIMGIFCCWHFSIILGIFYDRFFMNIHPIITTFQLLGQLLKIGFMGTHLADI